jgi:hypothetical protein
MSVLLERARGWRRQRALVESSLGAGRLFFGTLVVLTVSFWLDGFFLLPQAVRFGWWLAGGAGILVGAYLFLWLPWRRNRWSVVLDEVARAVPELRAHLLPAWELRESASPHTSKQLAEAHLQATEKLLEVLPPGKPVFRRVWSRRLRSLAAGAVVCLLTWPWVGKESWERVLRPWRDIPLEHYVAIRPGDSVWSLGQPATISVQSLAVAGGPRHAAETRLWLKTSGNWRPIGWERQTEDAAAFVVASVAEPLQYRLTWRSLESGIYRLDPRPVPQLESLQAKLSGETAAVPLSGADPLAARQGTWVVVSGRPNQPLARVFLKASFLPAPTALKCSADGGCEVGFFAQQDGSFQFDLEATDGRKDPAPVTYALKAVPDEPPTVELLSPLQPVQASPASVLPLAYSAKDDSGLTRATLLVRVPGRPETELPLQRFGRNPPKTFVGDYSWDLSGLPVGAKVAFRVKVFDDAVPSQSGVSEPGLVEIVDFEAGHRAAEQRWLKTEELLGRLADREERLRDRYAAGDAAGAKQELPGLPEAWKEAATSMDELSQAMNEDALANPGLSEEFSGLASDLRRTQSEDVPAALDADRRQDASGARSRHGHLAEAARRAQSQLKKGHSLQGLQDFYMQAGRLSQDGEQLASALDAMSGEKGGQFPSEALKRIQDTLKRIQDRMAELQKAIEALPAPAAGSAEAKTRRSYSMPLLSAQTSADALQAALRSGDMAMAAQIAQELARQLSQIETALTAAAASGAGAAPRSSAQLDRLQAQWSEVAEQQGHLLEASQGMEERRRDRFLAGQKDFLAKLAAEESVLVSSAAAWGADFPAGALPAMQTLRDEFTAGRADRALERVGIVSATLRDSAQRPSQRPDRPEAMRWFAATQEDIGRKLSQFPTTPPAEGPGSETAAASQRQSEVRGKTGKLQKDLQALQDEYGVAPMGAMEGLEGAQSEQHSAESSLDQGDTAGALGHQGKALEMLEQGRQSLERSAAAQKSIEMQMDEGFSRPASGVRSGPGGKMGARLEFVPMPTAKDYQPPKEIREELEHSLRERRPAAYDGIIKDYFKRISQ